MYKMTFFLYPQALISTPHSQPLFIGNVYLCIKSQRSIFMMFI